MIPLDKTILLEIAPRFTGIRGQRQAKIVAELGSVLTATLEAYAINNRLRIAHFLGQTCHECAGFQTTEEFADGSRYEGRKDLGNVKRGDGPRYKGRGILQLTGRANYREYGNTLGLDLENNPELAAEPRVSLKIACEYWKRRKINPHCDTDDVVAITRKINGGLNGLADRRKLTAKAKAALARIDGLQLAGASKNKQPVLHRGSDGKTVAELQTLLHKLGHPIAIDQDFGAATELAIMAFQEAHGLEVDGIVGPETWKALKKTSK